MIHTVLLDGIDGRVHLAARAVKVSSMNVYAERFAADELCVHSGRIGQPVVGMNDVKLLRAGQHTCDDREIVYLIVQVAGISSGEAHASHVIQALHVVEIGIDVVTETVVILYRMSHKAILDIIVLNVTPGNRHLTHIYYFQEFLLITAWTRHTERGLHIALCVEAPCDAVGGNSQAAVYLWRELPTEH